MKNEPLRLIAFLAPDEFKTWLEKQAKERAMTTSSLIRLILKKWRKKMEKKD